MINLVASTTGEDPIHFISSIKPDVKQFQGMFRAIVPVFYRQMEERLERGGAGGPRGAWRPLSDAYERWKAKHYPGRGILIRTGAMKDSLTGGAGSIVEYSNTSVFIGSDVRSERGFGYPAFHQDKAGGDRPPIDPSPKDIDEWLEAVQRYFEIRAYRSRGFVPASVAHAGV